MKYHLSHISYIRFITEFKFSFNVRLMAGNRSNNTFCISSKFMKYNQQKVDILIIYLG